eukprot:s112_g34.t1
MALIRFLLVLGLVCHWLACLWALTLQLSDDQSPKWIDGIRESDQVNQMLASSSKLTGSSGAKSIQILGISTVSIYLASFYFCSYTMTSVGYGDLGPKNMTERTVCTMMILTAGLCWAYVLGEVCGIVTEMSIDSQRFRKRDSVEDRSFAGDSMHQLNAMMDHQDLPKPLRLRLRSFFLQNRYQAFYLTQQELLKDSQGAFGSEWPGREMSPQLQSEVCTALHLPWIEKVSFLQQFMKLIRFQEAHLMASPAGLVALDNRIGHDGTVWGEDFVLSDLSLIRPVDAFALTYVEVMCLSREGLMSVVERRKRTCPYLGRLVRRYCVRVAASRGVLAEAKRRTRLTRLSKLRSSAAPRSTVTSATVTSALSETPAPPAEPVVPLLPERPERVERAERHEAPEAPEAEIPEASCSVTLPQVPMQCVDREKKDPGQAANAAEKEKWFVMICETSRLLRREQHRFKLWEEAVEAATGEQVAPSFRPEIRRCNYSKADALAARLPATPRRSQTQRALREVKEVLAEHQVPLILMGGLALGYYNSCAAMVGDRDRVVATFGPWLEDRDRAGLSSLSSSFEQRGHRLDLRHCKAGPMNAGCKLSVTLFDQKMGRENLTLEIQVLFSAPPAAVARPPGHFTACPATCGERCGLCGLAYAQWTPSSQQQDRFFPCPVPLRNFVLAAWMNETFWIPENIETYLEAEPRQEQSKPLQVCTARETLEDSSSTYETLVVLPKGSEILHLQREAQREGSPRIAAAAVYDRHIWHKYFAEDANSKSSSPWVFAETSASSSPSHLPHWFHRWPLKSARFGVPSVSAGLTMPRVLLAVTVAVSLAAAYVIPQRLSVCSMRVLEVIRGQPSDGGMFGIYITILLGQTFSQYLANASGLVALAAAILWQCAHLLWATGVVWHHGGLQALLSSIRAMRRTDGALGILCFNTFLGICVAASQWLSFISLSWLEPASYILFVQVSLLLAEVPGSQQKFGKVHGLALAIVVLAFMVKGLQAATEQDLMLYRGLVAVLIQVLLSALVILCRPLLQEVEGVSRDLMVLVQGIQGLVRSPFFHRMFTGDWCESAANKVSLDSQKLGCGWLLTFEQCNLQGLTKDGLELALEFLYTAKLEPKSLDDFGEALLVLKFLLMDAAVEELLKKLDRSGGFFIDDARKWDVHPTW